MAAPLAQVGFLTDTPPSLAAEGDERSACGGPLQQYSGCSFRELGTRLGLSTESDFIAEIWKISALKSVSAKPV